MRTSEPFNLPKGDIDALKTSLEAHLPWAQARAASWPDEPSVGSRLELSNVMFSGGAEGVTWNTATGERLTFEGAKLTAVTFDNFSSLPDFTGAILEGVTFRSVNLSRASFKGALLIDCEFITCEMLDTDFEASTLQRVLFYGGRFLGCSLKSAKIEMAEFTIGSFAGVDLTAARVDSIRFEDVQINQTPLSDYYEAETIVEGASLRQVLGYVNHVGERLSTVTWPAAQYLKAMSSGSAAAW